MHPKLAQKLARHSDINMTMNRYSHTLLSDESEALKVLPEFPSVFGGSDNQRQALRATGTDAADIPPQNVLPLCLPEKGAPMGNSVHLSAVSEALSDADIVNDTESKNPLKPLANKTKDDYDAEAKLAPGEVAEWPNAPVLKTGVV